jgi:predicted ATPase
MINHLSIRNFKCFEALSLPLAPLTLLTGFNAAGKSTALQTLLLLAQATRQGGRSRLLPLNGELTSLGSPGDVVREGGIPEVMLGVRNSDIQIDWKMAPEDRQSGHTLTVKQIDWKIGSNPLVSIPIDRETKLSHLLPQDPPELALNLLKNLKETTFISAVRAGAEDVFPSVEIPEPVWGDVGVQGEYAAWWFEKLLDEEIDSLRRHPRDSAPNLRRQFNAWAGELFPGAQANALRLGSTRLVQLELRNHDADKWRRPANIGYGLSYAFPILVAGLIARPGQTIIIDSPEAHLHPMGQSKIGAFLAMIAASGVQIILETHSDHVLSGIRLAIKQGTLTPAQAAIHFFNPRPRSASEPAHVVSPQIDKDGNFSEWPEGFFDQAEKDLAKLAGWN